MDCIFCKIVAGEIPSKIVYQDESVIAFPDVNPLAPTHLLIIPRKHIHSMAELAEDDSELVAAMVKVANQLARSQGISGSGYRLVTNSGVQGGQGVPHLHWHLLGGRQLSNSLG